MAPKFPRFQSYRKDVVYHEVSYPSKRVTTAARMRVVLRGEWDWVTIGEINAHFQRLRTVMQRCIAVDGGNNFHC